MAKRSTRNLARNVKRLRLERGWTQEQLAAESNLRQALVNRGRHRESADQHARENQCGAWCAGVGVAFVLSAVLYPASSLQIPPKCEKCLILLDWRCRKCDSLDTERCRTMAKQPINPV